MFYFQADKAAKQTKKPVNRFLQDDASAGIRSLQTSIEIKLCQSLWNGLQGGFPLFAETTRSELASTHWLAEQFPVTE